MTTPPPSANLCPQCGKPVPRYLLMCPSCGGLLHSQRLTELAGAAGQAATRGDATAEVTAWREALELLPEESHQHAVVSRKIEQLSHSISAAGGPKPKSGHGNAPAWLAALGGVGLLLWKFKALLLIALTKGKLLLTGLFKLPTLLSMFASLGVYWAAWGWKFALGIVLSIYVHEMGHIAEFRRFGIKATAPMFIPGIGAFIRAKQHMANAREESRIGLAGPIWGLGAALACLGLWFATDEPFFVALARVGAWINLFNLTPVWQLDGDHGMRSMTRVQKWLVVGAMAGCWLWVHDGLLLLVFIVGVFHAFIAKPDPRGDWVAVAQFIGLLAALGVIVKYAVPVM